MPTLDEKPSLNTNCENSEAAQLDHGVQSQRLSGWRLFVVQGVYVRSCLTQFTGSSLLTVILLVSAWASCLASWSPASLRLLLSQLENIFRTSAMPYGL